MKMDSEKIIEAAEKCGFNLEFRTKRILDVFYTNCNVNKLVNIQGETLEIDLMGSDERGNHIVVECKGSSTNDYLILIKEQSGRPYEKRIEVNEYLRINQFIDLEEDYITFTGDFHDNQLKRKSKDDTKNNFYKAQEQINDALNLYTEHVEKKEEIPTQFILPIIVTNAKIWVVNFETSTTNAKNIKWAYQRVKNTHYLGKDKTDYLVPVINIDYLEEFLNNKRDSYPSYPGALRCPSPLIV